MKIIKFSLAIDTLIKLFVISALILAVSTKQQFSYYNFLRWLIIISFIYFCYKSYNKKLFGLIIYFGMVAILFNPFYKFWFQKNTWHLIDYSVAGITSLTIFYDWILYIKERKGDKT